MGGCRQAGVHVGCLENMVMKKSTVVKLAGKTIHPEATTNRLQARSNLQRLCLPGLGLHAPAVVSTITVSCGGETCVTSDGSYGFVRAQ